MAVKRDRPFAQFNFLVDLGTGQTDGPDAGFQECSNLGMEYSLDHVGPLTPTMRFCSRSLPAQTG